MSKVPSPSTKGILQELKEYSFENNADFKNGIVSGYEVNKSYYHTDPRLLGRRDSELDPDIAKTEYGFTAYRSNEKVNGRPAYEYCLTATVRRILDSLEPHLKLQLDDHIIKEAEGEPGALSESFKLQFNASDHETRSIYTMSSYAIMLYDDIVMDTTELDLRYTSASTLAFIPKLNTKHKRKKILIPDAIAHEKLPDEADRLIVDVSYQAIVNPFERKQERSSIDQVDAARRMSVILRKMRTGALEEE